MRLLLSLLCVVACLMSRSQPTLVITNLSNSGVITCTTPSVNLLGALYNYTPVGTIVFNWASATTSITGANANIGTPGFYTLTATDAAGNFSISGQVSISINTVTQVSTVNTSSQNIACGIAANFFGSSNLSNVTHMWTSPYSQGSAVNTGLSSIYNPTAVGIFTYCVINNANGCSTCKTVTVGSTGTFPTFTAISSTQFTLGCGSLSLTAVTIGSASTQSGAPLSYTILPPFYSGGAYLPGPVNTFTTNTPGTYTLVVKDNQSSCETKIPVSIIQNTTAPVISVIAPTQTLSCYVSNITLSTFGNNIAFSWTSPAFGSFTGNSVPAFTSTNSNSPIAGIYTIAAIDNANGCKSSDTYTVYQNIFKPNPLISGPNALTCTTSSLTLTNISTSGIPTQPQTQPVIVTAWVGPPPQLTQTNTPTYQVFTPGVYTMSVKDLNNGCLATTVKVISDNRVYPVILTPPHFNINCPNASATLSVSVPSPVTYTWSGPSLTGPVNNATVNVSSPGSYTVTVANISSGCSTSAEVIVEVCAAISQQAFENGLNVFPNPVAAQLTIENGPFTHHTCLKIYSLSGVLINQQGVTSEKTNVDLQQLPAGIYFIYLLEGQKTIKATKILKN